MDYAVRHNVLVIAGAGDDPSESVASPANCVGALAIGGLADLAKLTAWDGESTGSELDFVMPGDRSMSVPLLNETVSTPTTGETSAATALASGAFALLRAKFPHDSLRMLVSRAIYQSATGRGTAGIGKRIDDRLGYGEILPLYALSESTPATAPNPIWDAVQKHLAETAQSSSPAPAQQATPSSSVSGGSSGGSGPPPILVFGVVIAVIASLTAGVVSLRRRSRARRGPPAPPPWPPYGGR